MNATMTKDTPAGAGTLHLIRGVIDHNQMRRWMQERDLEDPGHGAHCLLMETFGEENAPRPFRVITNRNPERQTLYGYSTMNAEALRELALAFQDPIMAKALEPASLDSKEMPANWTPGQRVGISIMSRPTIRIDRDESRMPENILRTVRQGISKPGADHDLFRWKRRKAQAEGRPAPTRQDVYARWLGNQLVRSGAAVMLPHTFKLDAIRPVPIKVERGGPYIFGTDVNMHATVTVTEPQKFASLLTRGIGRQKAFGYGMLLLQPA